ncbi:hypothetical protein ACOPX2_004552 [Escherichia coli]|uniref:hypothetical protein n=1 Tax=Escherichia coli TaxID=562 RepID=UPI0006B4F85B|nr:hypothetical protein [Escherichia coli]
MTLPVFITVIADHDKPQPSGCLLESLPVPGMLTRNLIYSTKLRIVQTCTEKIPKENNTISMELTREVVKMFEEQMMEHKGSISGTVPTQRELEKKFATAAVSIQRETY